MVKIANEIQIDTYAFIMLEKKNLGANVYDV